LRGREPVLEASVFGDELAVVGLQLGAQVVRAAFQEEEAAGAQDREGGAEFGLGVGGG
jgi:hypothetical protein